MFKTSPKETYASHTDFPEGTKTWHISINVGFIGHGLSYVWAGAHRIMAEDVLLDAVLKTKEKRINQGREVNSEQHR